MKIDVYAQLTDYRGVLGWNSYTDGLGTSHPHTEVPLFIKEHPLPVRKPKITEVSSLPLLVSDGTSIWDSRVNAIFEGTPDILQMELTGWLITPVSNRIWVPVDVNGSALNLGNISYADLITMYIDGNMNPNVGGYLERKDPDYYISPYGQQYLNPIIASWQPQWAPVQKKQQFTMTLYMEN